MARGEGDRRKEKYISDFREAMQWLRAEADRKLATALRIVAPPGARPQLLTAADGERFTSALALVAEAVRLFRELAPEMSEDLLTHSVPPSPGGHL